MTTVSLPAGNTYAILSYLCTYSDMKFYLVPQRKYGTTLISQGPSAIDSESIKPLSVLHSGLKRDW